MATNINVRVSDKERKAAQKLIECLVDRGLVKEASLSNAIRWSLRFACKEVFKIIEAERIRG